MRRRDVGSQAAVTLMLDEGGSGGDEALPIQHFVESPCRHHHHSGCLKVLQTQGAWRRCACGGRESRSSSHHSSPQLLLVCSYVSSMQCPWSYLDVPKLSPLVYVVGEGEHRSVVC